MSLELALQELVAKSKEVTVPQPPLNPYGFREPKDEIIAEMILIRGKSLAAVARELGIVYGTLLNRVNHPTFQVAIRRLQDDLKQDTAYVKARIELVASMSLDRLVGLLDSQNEDIVKSTAFGLLDRAGHSVKQQAVVTHVMTMSPESAKALAATFKEIGEVIDVGAEGTGNGS